MSAISPFDRKILSLIESNAVSREDLACRLHNMDKRKSLEECRIDTKGRVDYLVSLNCITEVAGQLTITEIGSASLQTGVHIGGVR